MFSIFSLELIFLQCNELVCLQWLAWSAKMSSLVFLLNFILFVLNKVRNIFSFVFCGKNVIFYFSF